MMPKMDRYCLAKKCAWAIKSGDATWYCLFGECPYGYSYAKINKKKIFDNPNKKVKHSKNYDKLCALIGLEP